MFRKGAEEAVKPCTSLFPDSHLAANARCSVLVVDPDVRP